MLENLGFNIFKHFDETIRSLGDSSFVADLVVDLESNCGSNFPHSIVNRLLFVILDVF